MTITVQSTSDKPEAVAAATKTEAHKAPVEVTPGEGKPEGEPSAPGADGSEQEPPATPEAAEPEEEEDEPQAAAKPEGDADPANPGPKKKGGFQRRIDKLNARMTAKEQEVEFWKQQALKGAGTTEARPPVEVKTTPVTEGKPDPEKFNTHAEYVEALAGWTADQKIAERDRKAEQTRLELDNRKVVDTYAGRLKAFAEKTPDVNEVLAEVDGIRISQAVQHIILTSENGPELAYELAKNPDEYKRVCALAPLAAAQAMGRIEARLAKSTEAKPDPKKTTNAPKPVTPVGTGGKGSVPKSIYDQAISQKDYEAIRAKQRAANGIRR